MEKTRCLQGARNTWPDAELSKNSKKNSGASEADGQLLDLELLLAAGTSTPKMCFFFVATSIDEVTVKIRGVCVGTTNTCSACVKKHSFLHKRPSVPELLFVGILNLYYVKVWEKRGETWEK